MKRKLTRKQIMENLGKIQDLVGRAYASYLDDRSPDRADKVLAALSEAFELAVKSRD